jgi:enoyl-CoA hydratase/carnithine racemase
MSEAVLWSVADGVATLRMNRPDKKNALTQGMYAAMAARLVEANDDAGVRCVLIAGAPGAFCAGNDIQDFLVAASQGGLGGAILDFLRALATSSKPLVAAVDGVAVGVGTTLLFHCDRAVASERSVFHTPFVDLGILPEAGSSLLGPRLLGRQRAFELLALGRRWSARDALAAGLIAEIAGDAEAAGLAVAREIAGKAPGALQTARRLSNGDTAEVLARIEEEAALFRERLKSPEAMAAFTAFVGRRG